MKFRGLSAVVAAVAMMMSGVSFMGHTEQTNVNSVAAAVKAPTSTIAFAGVKMQVVQGNTKVTSAPKANLAQTWGGQTNLSVRDNQSTHIIGHNTSSFGKIKNLRQGSAITVRDNRGQVKVYHVTKVANVNDHGIQQGTKQNVMKSIVSAKQGEQIVLQTCLSKTMNRLVWAR